MATPQDSPTVLSKNHTEVQSSPQAHDPKYLKIVNSTYFRIGLTAFLMLLLFLTAFLIAVVSESKKQKLKQSQEQIPEAKVIIPTSNMTPTTVAELDMSNWKTYTNEENGFTFKYPVSWSIETDTHIFEKGDLVSVIFVGKTQKTNTEFYDGGRFAISLPIETAQDIETWVKEYYEKTTTLADLTGYSEETVGNLTYQKVYICGLGCFNYYNIKKGNNVFQILTFAEGPDKEEYKKTVNQILSTFQFLN